MTWGLGGRRERAEQEGDPEEERICRRERERERERPVDQTEEEMQIKKRDRQGTECEEADRGE